MRMLQRAGVLSVNGRGAAARQEAMRIDSQLERLSIEYGLASSAVSLVAVVKRASDVAGELPKTKLRLCLRTNFSLARAYCLPLF